MNICLTTLLMSILVLAPFSVLPAVSDVGGQEESLSTKAVTEPNKENWKVYYDVNWKPVPLMKTEAGGNLKSQELKYGPLPCTCASLTCGCCLNMNLSYVNFNRTGCMNFSYLPFDFAIEMNVLMNNESIYKNSVSAKNPPPLCMEVPLPYIPSTQFCVKLYDIYTPGGNLHMCVDFETRILRAPVLILQFDCVQMGVDGVSHVKPSNITDIGTDTTT